VAAGFLVAALPISDEIGFAMTVALMVWHGMRIRSARRSAGA
jgi:uncharacterized membrane protein